MVWYDQIMLMAYTLLWSFEGKNRRPLAYVQRKLVGLDGPIVSKFLFLLFLLLSSSLSFSLALFVFALPLVCARSSALASS